MPADLDAALDALRAAVDEGRLSWGRIDDSLRRILRAKLEYLDF